MLAWYLKWGSELKTLQEIQDSTGVTPQGLQEQVELQVRNIRYWEYFWLLHRGRGANDVGLLPIQVGEVMALLNLVEETHKDSRLQVLRHVQSLDQVMLADSRKKAAA